MSPNRSGMVRAGGDGNMTAHEKAKLESKILQLLARAPRLQARGDEAGAAKAFEEAQTIADRIEKETI